MIVWKFKGNTVYFVQGLLNINKTNYYFNFIGLTYPSVVLNNPKNYILNKPMKIKQFN